MNRPLKPLTKIHDLAGMNRIVHLVVKYLYALFLWAQGSSICTTSTGRTPRSWPPGTPSLRRRPRDGGLGDEVPVAFHLHRQTLAGVLIVLPGREQLGVLMAFPYALGMLMWGIFMVPSHIVIMSAIFLLNALLFGPIGAPTRGCWSNADQRWISRNLGRSQIAGSDSSTQK